MAFWEQMIAVLREAMFGSAMRSLRTGAWAPASSSSVPRHGYCCCHYR
jgi:hypothetical protein